MSITSTVKFKQDCNNLTMIDELPGSYCVDDKLEPIVGRSVKKDTSLKFSADTNNGIADVRITGDINGTPHDDRYDLEDLSKGITFPK